MAKCPNCTEQWLWDWCQDAYRYSNGDWVETGIHFHNREEEDDPEVTLFVCKCGSVNSTMSFIGGETLMTYVRPWADIDWETEGHSYD